MAMNIYWTDFSKAELRNIFDYYKPLAGLNKSSKLIAGIINSAELLCKQPNMGQVEFLLSERSEEFRYLVYKNYKLIYWINAEADRIEIVDVFDTRQNPIDMVRSIEKD
jgi:plasmid stabilization system protein ParE